MLLAIYIEINLSAWWWGIFGACFGNGSKIVTTNFKDRMNFNEVMMWKKDIFMICTSAYFIVKIFVQLVLVKRFEKNITLILFITSKRNGDISGFKKMFT